MMAMHGHSMAGLSVDVKLRTCGVNPTELQHRARTSWAAWCSQVTQQFESMKAEQIVGVCVVFGGEGPHLMFSVLMFCFVKVISGA